MIAEAYSSSLLVNHYFPWVYQYKIENLNNTLITEYDQTSAGAGGDEGGNDDDQQEPEIDLFYGDLDLAKCEILVPVSAANTEDGSNGGNENEQQEEEARNDDFKLLLVSGPNADPQAHKAARDHDQEILKGIKAKIDLDRQGNGDAGIYKIPWFLQENELHACRRHAPDLHGRCHQHKKVKAQLQEWHDGIHECHS